MSVATQITRLQGVRDQIRTKMVGLGLSSNTDLLQDLADDLDGVSKISPTNNGTTDPGTGYTNVDTLSRSTSTRYIKVPKGYNDTNRKFTISGVDNGSVSAATTTDPGDSYTNQTTVTPSGTSAQYVKISAGYLPNSKITVSKMAAGSVASATTTDPGTDYANKTTVTPSLDKQYVKLSAGYLPNSKVTVEAIPNQKKSSDVSVGVSASISDITSIDTSQATSGVTVTASASGSVTVPLGYYSSAVTSNPTASDSTTIKPVLATSVTGSTTVPSTLPSGTVTITPNTDNTKRIYSDSTNKGFVTNIVLNAMDTSSVSSATTTDPGTGYANKATVTPSTSAQYIKITKGYLPNSKITVSKMADGSLSSATTTNPGDSYANRVTVTPSGTSAQYIKISKGYLPDGKITINKMSAGSVASATTTNPGDSYANQTTVTPSGTDAQYVKISAGYLPNSKITINKMASGSVSSASTTDPGTDYTNKTTVTPSLDKQYVKLAAGYLPNSKITVNAIPNQKTSDDVTASVTAGISDTISIDASQVTDGVTVTAVASGFATVPAGYYSTQITKDAPADEMSTTIKPKLAGTNGAIELTAGTSAFTKTSTANYSNGFITSVKVNPTPSETKEFTPTRAGGTVSPTPGSLLSSVTVKGVPYFSVTLSSNKWKSDSDVTAGKYYYDISDANITDSSDLYVAPGNGSVSAAQSFGVYAYSQIKMPWASTGTLKFRAIEKPTSDLTYNVFYLS